MRLVAVIAFAIFAAPAFAQASLDDLIARGYVEEWLVCGPFRVTDPGIVERVSRRLLPLPDADLLEAAGGVRRARPQAGETVATDDGDRTWQTLRADGTRIDFSPLTSGAGEAVAFAACTIRAPQPMEFLVDLQTLLGARLWLNGFPVATPSPVAPTAAGLQRHVVQFRRGDNYLLLQVPLVPLGEIAAAEDMSAQALRDAVLATRPMLGQATGWEAALRFRPAARAGQLVFVPLFTETGRFTGQGATLAQELAVQLFNPGPGSVGPASLQVRFGAGEPWITKAVRAIPPQTEVEILVGMPLSGYQAGEARAAEVQIETADAKGAFAARVAVRASPSRGTAYIVSGFSGPVLASAQSSDVTRRMTELARHLTLLDYESEYGFYLGPADAWSPYLSANPDARAMLREAVTRGRAAANAGLVTPDERIVSGEVLARNLLHGRIAAVDAFGLPPNVLHDWHARGVAQQSIQLFDQSSIIGRALNAGWMTAARGPLSLLGLDGSRMLAWSSEPFGELRTTAALQTAVAAARDANAPVDAAIHLAEFADESAPVYLLNETAALREGVPSIRLEASGPALAFESAREFGDRNPDAFPAITNLPAAAAIGEVIVQRPLKDAYVRAEALTSLAERFAALAAFHRTAHPSETLDWAWRQLLFYSEPNVMGRAESPRVYLDAVNGFHGVAATSARVLNDSLQALARHINTAANAPRGVDARGALIVFNPSFHPRTDVCEWRLPQGAGSAFSIVDPEGAAVPYVVRREPAASHLQFVAADVPAFGYRTYYLIAGGGEAAVHPGAPNTIENDFFRITADPEQGGAMVNLESKAAGVGLLGGLGNDVLVLQEDPALAKGGRELWATGIAERVSARAAQVQTVRSAAFEQMRIVAPLAGGEVTRTITVYKGIPRIDCETVFRAINARERALAIAFAATGTDHTLATGERFGRTVNAVGGQPLTPQTENGSHRSASFPRPALQWAALSANDHVRAGANIAVPIRPAVVVHGEDHRDDAKLIAETLARRGIPCVVVAAADAAARDAAIVQGHTFIVSIGSPDRNEFTAQLLNRLDEETRGSAEELIGAGQPYLAGGVRFTDDAPMIDALMLGGAGAGEASQLVTDVANALRDRGALEVPPGAYAGPRPRPLPTRGMALVFEGTNLAVHGEDGSLALIAAHDGAWEQPDAALPIDVAPLDFTLRYSLIPIEEDWRAAAIPSAANDFVHPLQAISTDLHLGETPETFSYGSVDNPAFIVTAFKRAAAGPELVIRGYEAHGMPGAGTTFTFARSMLRIWASNPIEEKHDPFSAAANGFRLELEPNAIATYAIDAAESGGTTKARADGVRFTRYWRHNIGAAPDAAPAASIFLDGDLDDETITVRVANASARMLDGDVQITPASGWTVAPESFQVALPPNEILTRRLLIVRPPNTPGGIVATLQADGKAYRDVALSESEPFALIVEPNGQELVVRVQNKVALPLSGVVELIAPPDAWPESAAATAVDPWQVSFELGPLEEHRTAFVWQGAGPPRWYGVKAYGNGHVAYASAR